VVTSWFCLDFADFFAATRRRFLELTSKRGASELILSDVGLLATGKQR
jgi:hypothetical protein